MKTKRDKFGRIASVCPKCGKKLDFYISTANNGFKRVCPKCSTVLYEELAPTDWETALCIKK